MAKNQGGPLLGRYESCPPCVCLKVEPNLRIACIEYSESIVKDAHCIEGSKDYRGANATIDALKTKWCIYSHHHGVTIAYIKALFTSCGCSFRRNRHALSTRHQNLDLNKPLVTIINTKKGNVDMYLVNLMMEHQVR